MAIYFDKAKVKYNLKNLILQNVKIHPMTSKFENILNKSIEDFINLLDFEIWGTLNPNLAEKRLEEQEK